MTLELAPTEDILAEVTRQRRPGQLIVGFAAETENGLENGRAKLLRKGVDAIVVNDVSGDGVGIDADRNAATFLTPSTSIDLPEMPKRKLADRILDEILTLRRPRSLMVEIDEEQAAGESPEPVRLPLRRAPTVDRGVTGVTHVLDPATREALEARLRFYRELGLTEFYRRPVDPTLVQSLTSSASA